MLVRKIADNCCIFLSLHSKTHVQILCPIKRKSLLYNYVTRRDEERRNTNSEVPLSKYHLISQPKLDKFQLQCYSEYSK